MSNSLNYHHLRYFHAIATEGNLTRAANKLRVSQSALSAQLKRLEESLGEALFDREHKSLMLTEAGRLVLDYADTIFATGDEMLATLEQGIGQKRKQIRIGAVTTLSRNFQISYLRPLLEKEGLELHIRSGSLRELLRELDQHQLDIVLANQAVTRTADRLWHSHLIDDQAVCLVANPRLYSSNPLETNELDQLKIILPSQESSIRPAFDQQVYVWGVRPQIIAEIDDMAMLRLFARESNVHTLVPRVVVQEELKKGVLVERLAFPEIHERFYAITPERRFPNEWVDWLLARKLS